MFTRNGHGAAAAQLPLGLVHGGYQGIPARVETARPARRAPGPVASPLVSVVIPAKDEAANLPGVLAELPDGLHEVILVDGASVDRTVETALRARPDLVIVRQTRRGKGNALACGFAACTGDVAVMLDADGSADPAEIPRFVDELRKGADFVKGSRFLPYGGSEDLSWIRRLGNGGLVFVMNRLFHTSYSDLCYGYNAFWTHCLDRFALPATDGEEPLYGDGFEIETLLAARAAAARLKVAEVPSFERARCFGASHLNTWRDGWRVLRTMLREHRGRTRVRAGAPAPMPAPNARFSGSAERS
jgi:glycosyltransferase involved in cell wall biosynthesis